MGDVAIAILVLMVEDLLSDLVGVLALLQLLGRDLRLDVVQYLSDERPGESWAGSGGQYRDITLYFILHKI